MKRRQAGGVIGAAFTTLSILGLGLGLAALAGCGSPLPDAKRSKDGIGNTCFFCGSIPCPAPDYNSYCTWNYGSGARAVSASNDAWSWHCEVGSAQYPITMDDLCLQQCGSPSIGTYTDASNPYSWSCTNANTDHCENSDGTEWMNITAVDPAGVTGTAGYEVIGERSPWQMHVSANQFATEGNGLFRLSGSFDGTPFQMTVAHGDNNYGLVTAPITSSSPVQHSVSLSTPCGTRTWLTRPLTRVFPNAAPGVNVGVSSTYVTSGTAVTLSVQRGNATPTSCLGASLLRVVGKQEYDGAVVMDLTFDGSSFLSKSFTVHPVITTDYTATFYCDLDPTIRATASATVTVSGPPLGQCPGNTTPPTFWFCRDCPYNTPPLTNTIVQTACTYDQALQLAEQTTFGGACNLSDGQCPSCPNPASCPGN